MTPTSATAGGGGGGENGGGGGDIEASETGAAVAVAIPAHILAAFRRQSTITSEHFVIVDKAAERNSIFSGRGRFRSWRLRVCRRIVPRRLHSVVFDSDDDFDEEEEEDGGGGGDGNEGSGESRFESFSNTSIF